MRFLFLVRRLVRFGKRKRKNNRRPVVNPKNYRPPRSKTSAKRAYHGSLKWENYALANQNPYMRKFLYEKQHGRCIIRGQPLSSRYMQIHHTTYNHVCCTGKTVIVRYRNSAGKLCRAECPPCEKCRTLHPRKFRQCANRLIAVHAGCHMKIHGIPER